MRLALILTLAMFLTGCERGGPPVKGMTPTQCRGLAAESYAEGLAEATVDPTIWGFGGYLSAVDYAEARRTLMLQICGG